MTVTWRSLAEARAWVKGNSKFWRKPCLVLLSGPMGAGKTQLVRWILSSMGSEAAASPSFAIHHRYEIGDRVADHFDLYRLQSEDELEACGFWDAVMAADHWVFVEWADRLPPEVYPKSRRVLSINLSVEDGVRMCQALFTDAE